MNFGVPENGTTSKEICICVACVLSNDTLPWSNISNYFPTFVNIPARIVGNSLQKCFYLLYAFVMIICIPVALNGMHSRYVNSYVESDCPKYYVFNFEHFTHCTMSTKHKSGIPCDNSPMYFLGHVFAHLLRISICIVWFYTIDRRYGVLKLRYANLTSSCREMNICVQVPVIVIMFPINLLVAVVFTYIGIPVVVMLAILNWVLKDKYVSKNILKPHFIDQYRPGKHNDGRRSQCD